MVLDEQYRQLEVAVDAGDQLVELYDFVGVHTGGRLVEKQELRLQRYGARDFKAALETVGQRPSGLVGAVGEPDALKQLHAFLARRRLLALPASDVRDGLEEIIFVVLLRGGHDVLEHRRGREKAQVLEGARDAARDYLEGLELRDALAFEDDVAARNVVDAGHEVEYRRLSGSVRPYEAGQLAFVYDEAHVADGLDAAERFVYFFKFKQCAHQRAPSSAVPVFLREKSFFR